MEAPDRHHLCKCRWTDMSICTWAGLLPRRLWSWPLRRPGPPCQPDHHREQIWRSVLRWSNHRFPLIYTCGDGVRRSWQCSALLHEEWREIPMTLSASPFLSPAGIQMHQEERTQEAWNVPRTKGAVRQHVVAATSNTSGDCGVPRGLAPANSWNMSRRVKQLRECRGPSGSRPLS